MIVVSSPAKIILFGEHAVVYDKLGIAAATGLYTKVSINSGSDDKISIKSENLGLKNKKNKTEIFRLIENIDKLREENKIDEIKELAKKDKLLPSFVVAGKIMREYGFKPCSIEIDSEVPKNLGSSASVFNGIAKAVLEFLGSNLPKERTGYFANEGDKVVHGTPSGIDAYTIAYGGWVCYRKSDGVKPLKIDFESPLIIVDSDEPARTGETVGYIRRQKEEKPEFVNSILDNLDKISRKGLDAIKSQNMEDIGLLMTKYYRELRKLDVSTQKLDEIVDIALKNNALGAKPTAGWGGGCCIVLAKNQKQAEELIRIYKEKYYNAFQTKLGVEEVKIK